MEVIGAFCCEVAVIEVGVGVAEGEAKAGDEWDIRIGNDVQTEQIGGGAVKVKRIVLVLEAGKLETAGEEGIERCGGRGVFLLIFGGDGEGDGEALVREECQEKEPSCRASWLRKRVRDRLWNCSPALRYSPLTVLRRSRMVAALSMAWA